MADTIRVANQGVEVLRNVLPARFNWPLFGVALLLMAVPVLSGAWQTWLASDKAATVTPSNHSSASEAHHE
jgi:hypothetical protein